MKAFPLQWPEGWQRAKRRRSARYQVNFVTAVKDLFRELKLMEARYIVLSTNVPLRQDGLPYAGAADKRYEDPGAAVYFEVKGEAMAIACDHWFHVRDNVRAIGLTVAAIRSIQRAGASEILNRAYTGFKALPPSSDEWWRVLRVRADASDKEIEEAYRKLAKAFHPDRGGDTEEMAKLNRAYAQARRG